MAIKQNPELRDFYDPQFIEAADNMNVGAEAIVVAVTEGSLLLGAQALANSKLKSGDRNNSRSAKQTEVPGQDVKDSDQDMIDNLVSLSSMYGLHHPISIGWCRPKQWSPYIELM